MNVTYYAQAPNLTLNIKQNIDYCNYSNAIIIAIPLPDFEGFRELVEMLDISSDHEAICRLFAALTMNTNHGAPEGQSSIGWYITTKYMYPHYAIHA